MLAYRRDDFSLEPAPFYTPNIFVRLGLFLFGNICVIAALGMFFLLTGLHVDEQGPGYTLITLGLGLIFPLEILMRKKKPFFRAGLEEALLYASLGSIYAGVLILLNPTGAPPLLMIFGFGLLTGLAAIRYSDSLVALLALGSGFYILFERVSKLGQVSHYLLPALTIFFSAVLIRASTWGQHKTSWKPWEHICITLRFAALLGCYAGGNYLVIRELSRELFGLSLGPGQDIPFAPLFYAYTFSLPVFYIARGLVQKDRPFLHAGFVCLALSVFTYKYYHHAIPLETGLTGAGLFLILMAWLGLRFFSGTRYGISAQPLKTLDQEGLLNVESLASLQGTVSQELPPRGPDGFSGGGGSFGGGGASEKF